MEIHKNNPSLVPKELVSFLNLEVMSKDDLELSSKFACFFINVDSEDQRFRITDSDNSNIKTLNEALDYLKMELNLNLNQHLKPISCHSNSICDSCLQKMDSSLMRSPMKFFGGWIRFKIMKND